MDEAVEAGLLVDALREFPDLLKACEIEVNFPLDHPKLTRWKLLALEVWGLGHPEDSATERIGESALFLPPVYVLRALAVVKADIEARLHELGVTTE